MKNINTLWVKIMIIEVKEKILDGVKGSPNDILSSQEESLIVLSPQERGCPMILGTSLTYYPSELMGTIDINPNGSEEAPIQSPQQNNSTLSEAASAGLTNFFKPLKPFSDGEYAAFKEKYHVSRPEKIDYSHKPRSTTGHFFDSVSETSKTESKSETKHAPYDPNNIPVLQGLFVTRKKPGEYHAGSSEIDHFPSSSYCM